MSSSNKENCPTENAQSEYDDYNEENGKTISFKDMKLPISPIVSYEYDDGTPYYPTERDVIKKSNKPKNEIKSNILKSKQNANNQKNLQFIEKEGKTFSKTPKFQSNKVQSVRNVSKTTSKPKPHRNECKNAQTNEIESNAVNDANKELNNLVIESLKQQLNAKDEEISQLRKLVSGMNMQNTNNSNLNDNNNDAVKSSLREIASGALNKSKRESNRKVSFSQIYTVLENEPNTNEQNEHFITRTVESPSLLRHNRPGTPHPKTDGKLLSIMEQQKRAAALKQGHTMTSKCNQSKLNTQLHAEIDDPTFSSHSVSTRNNFRTTPMPNVKKSSRLLNKMKSNVIDCENQTNCNNGSISKTSKTHSKFEKKVCKYDGYIKERPNYLTPAKIHYANVMQNDETPKHYENLVYALTPGALDGEKNVSYDEKFSLKKEEPTKNIITNEMESVASVSSNLDSVLAATESIRGTMSRLPQSEKKNFNNNENERSNAKFSSLQEIVAHVRSRSKQIDENVKNVNNNKNINENQSNSKNHSFLGSLGGNDSPNPNVASGKKSDYTFGFDWTKKNDNNKNKGFSFMKH